MRLGLGTGSTARHFVELLGERVAAGFQCLCVPTSEVTAAQARALNIPLTDLDTIDRLDVTIDGADEIGPGLDLIKGGGGALLREKIVAAASDAMIVIADASKLVETLGRFPLPIEVNRFGLGATRRALESVLAEHDAEGGLKLRLSPNRRQLRHRWRPPDPRCFFWPHFAARSAIARIAGYSGRGAARAVPRTCAKRLMWRPRMA